MNGNRDHLGVLPWASPGRLRTMHFASAPVPVRIVGAPADWPGWLSFISAVIALVIALYAIWQAYKQANDSRREIADERRKVFELEILRDLLGLQHASQIWSGRSLALVEALPRDDLPLWRAMIRLEGPDQYLDPGGTVNTELEDRWKTKITEILDRRGAPPAREGSFLPGALLPSETEVWSERLWQALVDDVKKSIKKRVEDDDEGPERKRGRRASIARRRGAVSA
jgi:hypothetical protein